MRLLTCSPAHVIHGFVQATSQGYQSNPAVSQRTHGHNSKSETAQARSRNQTKSHLRDTASSEIRSSRKRRPDIQATETVTTVLVSTTGHPREAGRVPPNKRMNHSSSTNGASQHKGYESQSTAHPSVHAVPDDDMGPGLDLQDMMHTGRHGTPANSHRATGLADSQRSLRRQRERQTQQQHQQHQLQKQQQHHHQHQRRRRQAILESKSHH